MPRQDPRATKACAKIACWDVSRIRPQNESCISEPEYTLRCVIDKDGKGNGNGSGNAMSGHLWSPSGLLWMFYIHWKALAVTPETLLFGCLLRNQLPCFLLASVKSLCGCMQMHHASVNVLALFGTCVSQTSPARVRIRMLAQTTWCPYASCPSLLDQNLSESGKCTLELRS
jgi:hypothetical protein